MANRGPILAVEDDEGILGFVKMALEDEGHEVMAAENGAVALSLIRERSPRLVLLDLRMPVMDGWEFARLYREMPGPHAPIILVTAGRDGHDKVHEIGAQEHLRKPFDLAELVELVAKYTT